MIAAFDAVYAQRFGPGFTAACEGRLIILPHRSLRIIGTAARDMRKQPRVLILIV